MPSSFEFTPLNNTKSWIRLISVQPGDSDHPIECVLRDHELTEAGHICLSYTWGSEQPQKNVLVNGRNFVVRKNLWEFLHTARRYGFQDAIWIDAICINQADTVERNAQVAMMGQIYRMANFVVMWLGLSDISAQTLYELDHLEPCAVDKSGNMMGFEHIDKDELRKLNQHDYEMQSNPEAVARWNRKLHSVFTEIARSEYWTRAWIVQEIALAEHLFMLTPLSMVAVDMTIWFYFKNWSYNSVLYKDFSLSCFLFLRPGLLRTSIAAALGTTLHRGCKELRDRIYSIRSVIRGGETLKVDYDASVEHVLWQTLKLANFRRWIDHIPNTSRRKDLGEVEKDVTMRAYRQAMGSVQRDLTTAFHALPIKPPGIAGGNEAYKLQELLDRFDVLEAKCHWICEDDLVIGPTSFDKNWSVAFPFSFPNNRLLLRVPIHSAPDKALGNWTPFRGSVQWWLCDISCPQDFDHVKSCERADEKESEHELRSRTWRLHSEADEKYREHSDSLWLHFYESHRATLRSLGNKSIDSRTLETFVDLRRS